MEIDFVPRQPKRMQWLEQQKASRDDHSHSRSGLGLYSVDWLGRASASRNLDPEHPRPPRFRRPLRRRDSDSDSGVLPLPEEQTACCQGGKGLVQCLLEIGDGWSENTVGGATDDDSCDSLVRKRRTDSHSILRAFRTFDGRSLV
jgi:hypothetical protein